MSAAHPLDALEWLSNALDAQSVSVKDKMVREAIRVLIESCELGDIAAARIIMARRACADSEAKEQEVISQENRALVILDKVTNPEPFISDRWKEGAS